MNQPVAEKVIATNRKARHLYHIEETFEAGIALMGTEVKSLRAGYGSITDGSFASADRGEIWLHNMHIHPYEFGNRYNPEPLRSRKLLLHAREIKKLIGKVSQSGYTLVPLRLYFKRGLVKVELGLARGKKAFDKRDDLRERDARR
ncbi:MAG: SsrA-binding protein SmpB [bacterium]